MSARYAETVKMAGARLLVMVSESGKGSLTTTVEQGSARASAAASTDDPADLRRLAHRLEDAADEMEGRRVR